MLCSVAATPASGPSAHSCNRRLRACTYTLKPHTHAERQRRWHTQLRSCTLPCAHVLNYYNLFWYLLVQSDGSILSRAQHTHTHTHTHTYIHTHTYTHTYTRTSKHTHTHTPIRTACTINSV